MKETSKRTQVMEAGEAQNLREAQQQDQDFGQISEFDGGRA